MGRRRGSIYSIKATAVGGRSIHRSIHLIAARKGHQLHRPDNRSACNQRHSLCGHPSLNFANCMGTDTNSHNSLAGRSDCIAPLISLPTSPFFVWFERLQCSRMSAQNIRQTRHAIIHLKGNRTGKAWSWAKTWTQNSSLLEFTSSCLLKFAARKLRKHDRECCHVVPNSLCQWRHKHSWHVWQKYHLHQESKSTV